MSLLQMDSPKLDDAARGEELTKGSSHVALATVAAAVLVTIAIALYVVLGQKPPAATGEIERVWVHPQHTVTSGVDANGASMPKESYDQVLVFTQVKLHNQSNQPIVLHNILTNATLDDGIHSSYAATPSDYQRLFLAYPTLVDLRGNPLALDTTLEPGQTVEGNVVSAFRMTKPEWDARKDLNFTFNFLYRQSLVLAPHAPLIEK